MIIGLVADMPYNMDAECQHIENIHGAGRQMINIKKLFMEPKLIIWMLAVLIALVAIRPIPTLSDSGTVTFQTNLKNGIDIEGGSRALILLKTHRRIWRRRPRPYLRNELMLMV